MMPTLHIPGVGTIYQVMLPAHQVSIAEELLTNFWHVFGDSLRKGMPLRSEWFSQLSHEATLLQDTEQGTVIVIRVKEQQFYLVIFADLLPQDAVYSLWTTTKDWRETEVLAAIEALYTAVLGAYFKLTA